MNDTDPLALEDIFQQAYPGYMKAAEGVQKEDDIYHNNVLYLAQLFQQQYPKMSLRDVLRKAYALQYRLDARDTQKKTEEWMSRPTRPKMTY